MEPLNIENVSNKNMMKIFQTLLDVPKTAQQISNDCQIPISTVYKKLKELENKKTVRVSGAIKDGVRCKLYQMNFKNLTTIKINSI
jgi:predicted transcriptional regulator